jgi:hypothetical protein
MKSRTRVVALAALFGLFAAWRLEATIPPREGAKWPKSYVDRKKALTPGVTPTFTYKRALLNVTRRIQANRKRMMQGALTEAAAAAAPGGLAVSGTRKIPVLMSRFSNTAAAPFPEANLQKELFDGPWPTGTMTEFYKEISYGLFTVTCASAASTALPSPACP